MTFKLKNRDECIAAFEAGMKPKEIVKAGIPSASAYLWHRQWLAAKPPPVEEVEEPKPIKSPTDPSPTARKGATVTEETAGLILQTLFGFWAMLRKNDICYLTAAETSQLRGPFAATLRSVPNPIAEMVNTYAPPVTFVTQLMEVVSKKQELIRLQEEREFGPVETAKRAAQTVAPPSPHDGTDPRAAAGDPQTNGRVGVTGVPEPEPQYRFGG